MRYTLTLTEELHEQLLDSLNADSGLEGAAYLLCGGSIAADEVRLLVREVVPVAEKHYRVRLPDRLSIESASYVPLAKRAGLMNASIVFVHTHPGGVADFSVQDDHEEPGLLEFLQVR